MIELAPATGLSDDLREKILSDAVRLLKSEKYRNAGTVEFLVDLSGQVRIFSPARFCIASRRIPLTHPQAHYFLEVNPRLQVGHALSFLSRVCQAPLIARTMSRCPHLTSEG